jgi:hypothetical protein
VNCIICNSENVETWPTSQLSKCAKCGHIWQTAVDKTIEYGAAYVERGYTGRAVPSLEMAYVRLATLYRFMRSGRVLDVGYGDGEFVRQANKRGLTAFGYDIHADEVAGVPIIDALAGDFDAVTLFDSLEHFQYLTHLFTVRPRFFVVTIPHTPADITDDKIIYWRHYKPNEHLHYFSTNSICALFARFGYTRLENYPIEDIIRKNPEQEVNTMTYIFKRTRGI